MALRSLLATLASLCVAAETGAALADEVFLRNGDRITGKVLSAAGDQLVVQPDFAKSTQVSIPQAEILSFTTDAPLVVELKDGAVLKQATARAEQAQVVLAPTDGEAARAVAVADIKRINPQAVAWHGTVGVNGLYGRSTTTAAQIGLNGEAARRGEVGRITLSGSYSYGVQKIDGVVDTNVNNWTLQGKYDHFFSPNWYAYLGSFAAGDTVNFLRLRTTPSFGTGRQWIDRGSFHFSTEGGATYLYEDYRTQPEPTQDIALRLAYHTDRAFQGGRINLAHNLEYLRSVGHPGDYLFSTDASVRVALTSRMFSELKGKLVYDNQPGFRAQNSTTELRLGVGLNY